MDNKADETISTPVVALYVYKCIVRLNVFINYSDSFHFKSMLNPDRYWIVFNVHKVIISSKLIYLYSFYYFNVKLSKGNYRNATRYNLEPNGYRNKQ